MTLRSALDFGFESLTLSVRIQRNVSKLRRPVGRHARRRRSADGQRQRVIDTRTSELVGSRPAHRNELAERNAILTLVPEGNSTKIFVKVWRVVNTAPAPANPFYRIDALMSSVLGDRVA